MPLDNEFKKHLDQLTIEVSEKLADEEAEYKSQLVWKAQQINNAGALPIAYKDAAIHALRSRVEKTVDKFLEAFTSRGDEIDATAEDEMRQRVNMLTSGPNSLQFPPGIRADSIQSAQHSYAMERQRVANQLNRESANRLRELKMKSKRDFKANIPSVTNVYNERVYNNSIDQSINNQSINNFEITPTYLQDIDRISEGHEELKEAAREIRAAFPQKATMFEKAQKWAALLGSIEGLTEKVHQHYPQIEAVIRHLSQ